MPALPCARLIRSGLTFPVIMRGTALWNAACWKGVGQRWEYTVCAARRHLSNYYRRMGTHMKKRFAVVVIAVFGFGLAGTSDLRERFQEAIDEGIPGVKVATTFGLFNAVRSGRRGSSRSRQPAFSSRPSSSGQQRASSHLQTAAATGTKSFSPTS
jgi:hypothetical protein